METTNGLFTALTKLLHFLQWESCTNIGVSPSGRLTNVDPIPPCVDSKGVGFEFEFFIDHVMLSDEALLNARFRKRFMMRRQPVYPMSDTWLYMLSRHLSWFQIQQPHPFDRELFDLNHLFNHIDELI